MHSLEHLLRLSIKFLKLLPLNIINVRFIDKDKPSPTTSTTTHTTQATTPTPTGEIL